MNPLVSVVIPTRGRATLLLRAIDSVLRQTFRQIEIVVVVDGPDDATHAALATVADERLRVISLSESVGGCGARNSGVQNAGGEWVAFLDDDDEWLASKIEKQLWLASQTTEPYPVISCQLIGKSPTGNFVWPRRFPRASEPLCEYMFNRTSFFKGEGLIQTSTLLIPRSLLELVPFTSGLRKHQDVDWYLRVCNLSGAKFYFVPEPLAVWYLEENRGSITNHSNWRLSLNWVKANRKLMTRRAYAGFISATLASEAAQQGQWRAFPELLKEMFRRGKPGFMELTIFMGLWFMRPSLRHKIRALRFSVAAKQAA